MQASSDPFDFPLSIVPKGMIYQWCAKTLFDEPHPSFTKMLEGGWSPVPAHRHRKVFASRIDADGNVAYGGQILMCRLKEASEEAHQLNEDAAYRAASAKSRLLKFDDIAFHLSANDMSAAAQGGMSCRQYALLRLKWMAEGLDPQARIRGRLDQDRDSVGALEFCRVRRPRHRWLTWLFNLISEE